jgi:hypothetical protein
MRVLLNTELCRSTLDCCRFFHDSMRVRHPTSYITYILTTSCRLHMLLLPSLYARYVQVARTTGEGPVLLVVPEDFRFEAWRLLMEDSCALPPSFLHPITARTYKEADTHAV